MSRYECPRCWATYHIVKGVNEEPHVCKDIARRIAKRERQVQEVMRLLKSARTIGPSFDRTVAERIVKTLANLGVEED